MLQGGWEPKESQDWLVIMGIKASRDLSGLPGPKARRGNRVKMARLRGPPGHQESGVLWVIKETVGSQATLDTLVKREFKASVESQASRASPGIQDPGDAQDPKDQKAKRAQRESQARRGHQAGGEPRDFKGCQAHEAWWGDRALRAWLDKMGILAGTVGQDIRESREMMGTLAPWALLGEEGIQVWLACLEHRGLQDSRVKVGCLGNWVPLENEGQKVERGFLETRGSQDPKASRVTLARWASQEWPASLDPRAPLETLVSKASKVLGVLLA